MSVWKQVQDDQGRTYYYNPDTQETSWENPDAELAGTWKAYTTEDGKEYYYNETTGVTTWEKPADLLKIEEQSTENDSASHAGNESGEASQDLWGQGMLELDKKLALEPLLESNLVNIAAPKSQEGAKVQFQTMLKDGGVDSTWSFEKVIKTFIKNKSYWDIDDAVERRTLYEDYLVSKLERESSNKSGLIEEFTKNFLGEIQKYLSLGKITHKTRWISAKNLLIKDQNPIFEHSILPDSELEKLFVESTAKLRLEEKEALQKEKDQALRELEGYLLQITSGKEKEGLTWDMLYERLQTDARFKANKHFYVLTKLDILHLYSSKIYPVIISKIRAHISSIEKVNFRADRHARDAFKAFLLAKSINANTLFKTILPDLENEDVFIELCGRNGSTPLELFWDVVEEKKQLQKVKKDLVEHSLRAHLDQKSDTSDYEDTLETFETFLSVLKLVKDERLADVDISFAEGTRELSVIHETLLNELQTLKKQEQVSFERNLDAYIHALADWIVSHQDSVVPEVLTFQERGESPKNGEKAVESEKTHGLIISVGDREATADNFSVDTAIWKDKFGNVDAFSRLSSAISLHYKKIPNKAETTLESALSMCLREVASLLTSSLTRKRAAPEPPTTHNVKRSRPEGERNPVLMNY